MKEFGWKINEYRSQYYACRLQLKNNGAWKNEYDKKLFSMFLLHLTDSCLSSGLFPLVEVFSEDGMITEMEGKSASNTFDIAVKNYTYLRFSPMYFTGFLTEAQINFIVGFCKEKYPDREIVNIKAQSAYDITDEEYIDLLVKRADEILACFDKSASVSENVKSFLSHYRIIRPFAFGALTESSVEYVALLAISKTILSKQ